MACEYHRGNTCAYPDWSPDRCEWCHCSWSKITAPATRITTRTSVGKSGKPITVEDVIYLDGYGELPLNHFWRHAIEPLTSAQRGLAKRSVA